MLRIWKPVVLQSVVDEPLSLAFLGVRFTRAFLSVELPPRRVVSPHQVMNTTGEDVAVRRDRAARAAELRISQAFESTSKRHEGVQGSNQVHESNLPSSHGILGKRPASTRMDCHEPRTSTSAATRAEAALSLDSHVSSTAGDDRGAICKRGRSETKDTPPQGKGAADSLDADTKKPSAADEKHETRNGDDEIEPLGPKTFRLISWNIDCLNPLHKMERVEEICSILLGDDEALPDAVLLQEVDSAMLSRLNARLGGYGGYQYHPARIPVQRGYFTMLYTRTATVTVEESSRSDFPGSCMGRDLIRTRCKFNGKSLLLMTSHMESEKQSTDERRVQFSEVLQKLLDYRGGPAIFAGDTNLREPEVKKEKRAKLVGDVWQLCGSDPNDRFTWDMAKNDNLEFGNGFKPRARYDRIFVNQMAKPSARSFSLLGTTRMAPPESCFPSDHFGMYSTFEW